MKNKNKKIITLVVFISAFILPILTVIRPVRAEPMQYFNLSIGSEMKYNSTDDSSTWITYRYIPEEWEFLGGIYGTFVVRWAEDWVIDDVRENQNYMLLSKKGNSTSLVGVSSLQKHLLLLNLV
jgi:hypothetical protein